MTACSLLAPSLAWGRTSDAAFGPQTFGSVVTLAGGQIRRYRWYLHAEEAREAAGLSE